MERDDLAKMDELVRVYQRKRDAYIASLPRWSKVLRSVAASIVPYHFAHNLTTSEWKRILNEATIEVYGESF